ncbi:MAG: ferredoxin family protein [Planctomycetes bacterium]|nr:ferredoxin family protein [Planctomycetota bacterium]
MSDWTVLLSGRPGSDPLAASLAAGGLTVLAAPDLADLPPDHVVFPALDGTPGGIVAAAPYAPRAIYWLLAAGGVRGRRADVAAERTKTAGRAIHPIDTTGLDDEAIAARVAAVTGPGDGKGLVRDFGEALPARWYPVIDGDRCTQCFECVEFCLFGVYEVDADRRVHVAIGDNCKTGCPACSRVCPAGAILFPRYPSGGPIAGADEGRIERLTGDAARKAGGADLKAYIARYGNPEPPENDLGDSLDELEAFEP